MIKKTWPWLVGTIGAIVWFAVFETLAFDHPTQFDTLSHTVSSLAHGWPMTIFFCGQFVGILEAHFFWPWAENPLGAGGG